MTTEDTREKMRQQDHDLIVRLDVKVTDIASDIKELKDGINKRIGDVETEIKSNREKILGLETKWKIAIALFAPIYLGIIGYLVTRFVQLFN